MGGFLQGREQALAYIRRFYCQYSVGVDYASGSPIVGFGWISAGEGTGLVVYIADIGLQIVRRVYTVYTLAPVYTVLIHCIQRTPYSPAVRIVALDIRTAGNGAKML